MKVVRYTFDVCLRSRIDKDVYTMATELEKGIMKVDGVIGCEAKSSHTELVNSVDVDKVIKSQMDSRFSLTITKGETK